MDPRFLKYAEKNAPRYTSYPTAPHFTADVDGGVAKRWLNALAPQASVSLYLHTPYCQEMCWYCGCHAYAAKRDEPIGAFVETLLAEIEFVGRASAARGVVEIHWGGGTPNILSAERFSRIHSALAERFDLTQVQRYAVEIDPRLLTQEQARTYAAAGVNRASLGVQDFDAHVQAAIGRVQPYEIVERAAALLRDAGVEALSFDLMYGLPGQTIASVTRTAERAAALNPRRFSVFGYAHVPWFKTRQRLIDETALPGTAERFELAATIRAVLERAGYVAIGYDHYARADDPIAAAVNTRGLSRNFQGFVEGNVDALIGIGPSAISTLPQGYAQNETEIGAWRAQIAAGALATKRGRALSDEDRLRRDLIMQLLCYFRVDLTEFGGEDRYRAELEALAPLRRDGLVDIEAAQIEIPEPARPFARLVAEAFDLYSTEGQARHSRAV